jgi:hypothetical protein
MLAALENKYDDDIGDGGDVDINRAWGNIKQNINASTTESLRCYELKQHKPWFDEECSKLLYQRKWAKLK